MRWLLLHAAVVALGVGVMFRPTLASGFARLQSDPGDTLLNHYILEHSWLWLTRADYCGTLWSPPCFHPQPLTLAYSENLLGTAPLYWLLRTAAPDTLAYQLWMMLVAALTYAGMAWALRRFGVGHLLAAFGAFVFAFGLPRLAQVGHQQLLPHLFAPPAVWLAWQMLQRPTVAPLAGLLAVSYMQVLAAVYQGWFLLFGLGLFAAAVALFDRGTAGRVATFLRERWLAAGVLVVVWAGLMAALVAPYREANRGFRRPFAEVLELTPRPADWLARGESGELCLFPGWVPLALLGLAAVRPGPRPALVRAGLVTAAVLVLVSLRVGDWTAWRGVYAYVPGGAAIRAVGRVVFTAELFALVAGLVALDGWLRTWPAWRGPAAAGLLLAVGLAEQVPPRPLPSFEVAPWAARVERLRERLAPGRPAYVELPPGRPFWESQLAAMWAGLRANVPVVNGYSGRYPRGYPDWSRAMTADELTEWVRGETVQMVRAE